jgi:hypothetical protein
VQADLESLNLAQPAIEPADIATATVLLSCSSRRAGDDRHAQIDWARVPPFSSSTVTTTRVDPGATARSLFQPQVNTSRFRWIDLSHSSTHRPSFLALAVDMVEGRS